MPPKKNALRKSSENSKAQSTNKKASKRKRKSSEDEDSKDQVENDEIKEEDSGNEEDNLGKFAKFKKDPAWKLKKIPHHTLPSFNMTKNNDIQNVRNLPLVQISLPHSVFVSSKFSGGIDFCHRKTIALNSYMYRLKLVKSFYLSAKKKDKNVRKGEKKGVYNNTMVNYAQMLELHPDKYFEQDYDFYFSGGNLCYNNRSSQIAHVAGPKLNTLVLSVLNVHNNIPKAHKLTSLEFKNEPHEECTIYELQISPCAQEYLFLRQRHCISIHGLRNGKIDLLQNFKTKETPFISFTQDTVNNHHLTMSDLSHKVRVCDIVKGVPIQTFKMMAKDKVNTSNNWNMIKSFGSNVYLYSMNKKVSLIDTRQSESQWQSSYCGTNEELSCNSFCSVARSKYDHLFYVASNHKVYCVDSRFMGKDVESKNAVVANWTHQMSSFPLMMVTYCRGDAEYITLQSPLNSDLRICENIRYKVEKDENKAKKARVDVPQEYMYKSPCIPYMPAGIESVFQEARLNGICLKQGTGICSRVKACVTGLDFTNDTSSRYLLTGTSNGDVFARQMYHTEDAETVDTYTASDVMGNFEENIYRSVRKVPLAVTEVWNLAGISKAFRCSNLSSNETTDKYPTKRKYMGRWQKSIYSLSKYKDALATDLLSIWDFDISDEKDLKNLLALNKTEHSESKVSGWLESNQEIAHSTMNNMTSIPMDVFNSTKLDSTLADTSLKENDQTVNLSQINLNQSVVAKPKIAKKKSRYIKGF